MSEPDQALGVLDWPGVALEGGDAGCRRCGVINKTIVSNNYQQLCYAKTMLNMEPG